MAKRNNAEASEESSKASTVPESTNEPLTELKEKTVSSSKEKTVSVDSSLLETILANQEELKKQIEARDKTIEMLTYAADKGRVANWENQNKGELIRKMTVGFWPMDNGETRAILGWQTVRDQVTVDSVTHRVIEEQIIRLFLENRDAEGNIKEPETRDVPHLDFMRNVQRVWGEVIKESREKGVEFRTIELSDGRRYEMDIRFLNL